MTRIATPTVWTGQTHVCTSCRLYVVEPDRGEYVGCPRCPKVSLQEAVLLRLTYARIGETNARVASEALAPMLAAIDDAVEAA